MEALTGEEMKKIDEYTCKNITPSIELMEIAGASIAKEALKHYTLKKVLLLVGSSGNGGDALVMGRHLMNLGIKVDAFLISNKLSNDCKTNMDLFKGDIYYELPELSYDLIVDGLIGFGLKSRLKDNYINIINKVNHSNIKILSIDIPTGIDATSGISYGAFIKSDYCITIEYPKTGLFLNDGLDSYKHLSIIPIGITKSSNAIHVNEIKDFKGLFPKRNRNTNKGSFGKSVIIAGSYKYPGASYISYNALNQFKMGIGYSYLYVPKDVYELYALRHPEVIVNSMPSIDGHIKYDIESLAPLLKLDSITIGMGMDVSKDLYDVILYLLLNYKGTLVLDADALNTIAKYGLEPLKNKSAKVILTPHIKEMERLSLKNKEEIISNSFNITKEFAKMYDVTLVLKSASTIITDGNQISISNFGNSALAKGGSGDMLSGILSGVLGYLDIDSFLSSNLACYILGRAAEFVVEELEEETVSPLDISNKISKVLKEIKDE